MDLKGNTFSRDINQLQIDNVFVQVIMMIQLYGDVKIQKISASSIVAYSYT